MCEPGQTFKFSQRLWEGPNVHYRPSITHSLLIHLLTARLTHTQTKTIHECWYGLIRALNTRLDASETHLSPYSCVEMTVSASVDVYVRVGANAICTVSGQSNSLSNDWFIIWLTRRLPPRLCLFPFFSSFIIHCILFLLSLLPPKPFFHNLSPLHIHCFKYFYSAACPILLLILFHPWWHYSDRITCANTTYTSAIWKVSLRKLLHSDTQGCK